MMKKFFIINAFLLICLMPVVAQETTVKREVTLYNPYKPSLNEFRKKSYLPEMTDTAKFKPVFRYEVNTIPYMPVYTVSPIKSAALLPDPLTKLYRSYVNIGLGTNTSPLAEISVTNERSKKGSVGFYGRHYSNNGKLKLANGRRVNAGYMDNDVSVFGRRFFRTGVLGGSADLMQKTRHAYGYDPAILDYFPQKKDTRVSYANLGAKITLSSTKLDSADFAYDFDLHYNYFFNNRNLSQHNFGLNGIMSKSFKGFYVGSGINYDNYKISDPLSLFPEYIFSLNPFLKKTTTQWNFKLGFQALLDRNLSRAATLHLYPDINFGFSIIPSYIYFFTGLSGKMERNDLLKILNENPYSIPGNLLFSLPNTDHQLVVTAGLKGSTGLTGNYLISASYSLIKDMLFYTNIVNIDTVFGRGNYFNPLTDDVDLLNLHGEMTQIINDRLTFNGVANFYQYTLTSQERPWNKPSWDASVGLKYNLRDKIIAGMQLTTLGKRSLIVNGNQSENPPVIIDMPYHVNLNLSAEYRYSKILSFWTKFDNISYKKYYEWAYYPSQRFLFMIGFTYSL